MLRDHKHIYDQTCGLGIDGGLKRMWDQHDREQALKPSIYDNCDDGKNHPIVIGSDLSEDIQATGMFAEDTTIAFTTEKELYRYAPGFLPPIEQWSKAAQLNIARMLRRA